jgi:hypothetical protein
VVVEVQLLAQLQQEALAGVVMVAFVAGHLRQQTELPILVVVVVRQVRIQLGLLVRLAVQASSS